MDRLIHNFLDKDSASIFQSYIHIPRYVYQIKYCRVIADLKLYHQCLWHPKQPVKVYRGRPNRDWLIDEGLHEILFNKERTRHHAIIYYQLRPPRVITTWDAVGVYCAISDDQEGRGGMVGLNP